MFKVNHIHVRPSTLVPFFGPISCPAAAASLNSLFVAGVAAGKVGDIISQAVVTSGDQLTMTKSGTFKDEATYNAWSTTHAAAITSIEDLRTAYNAAVGITYTKTTETV
jgi:hypothetical protein